MDREPDRPARPQDIGWDRAEFPQRIARVVLTVGLTLLGLWIVHSFLPALAWAGIFAIATWPLYQRLLRALAGPGLAALAPPTATLLIGLVFVLPLVWVALQVVRETGGIVEYIGSLRRGGIPLPEWLPRLPGVGGFLAGWWRDNLSDPQAAQELIGHYARIPAETARQFGGEVIHRVVLFGFTLLTVFFLFRDGTFLGRQLVGLGERLLGPGGDRVSRHMIAAVHGTVNGLVLVGLAEGVLLGIAYVVAGLPHPVSVAAVTGVLAVIPFGAPLAFGAASLYLAAEGATAAAAGIFGFGLVVVFLADHVARPYLIGGAARLPFLWVLLGILGGLETFGLLGLFLGPMTMAALMSLWRDWTQGAATPARPSVGASRRSPPRRSGR